MQSYLNFAPLTVYVDTAGPIAEIRRQALEQPGRFFRIGSGEVGDSLLLDPIFGLTAELIRGLSDLPNVAFEAKTKTSFVDHLLDIGDKGQAVIGFSLNPGAFSDDEGISAPVTERISAAARAAQAGYRIAFHFDPIVRIDAWEREYAKLIGLLRDIPEEQVAWISMGTIRYTHGLRDRIVSRPYLYDEFVPGKDGKYRYLQRIRTAMYTRILAELRLVFAKAPVYLCMESEAVWERVFGTVPERLPELAHVFDSYALQEVR
jgi:spore photoproduct lyase